MHPRNSIGRQCCLKVTISQKGCLSLRMTSELLFRRRRFKSTSSKENRVSKHIPRFLTCQSSPYTMSPERTPMKKGDIESRLRSHANTPQAISDIDSEGLSGAELSDDAQTPTQKGERLEGREEGDPRERALQHELTTVRKINRVIEGVLQSFDRADHNVDVRVTSCFPFAYQRLS